MRIWALAFLLALAVDAQDSALASVSGTIVDQTSAVMANTTVELRGQTLQFEAKTTREGKFVFESVPVGEYILVSSSIGFYPSLVSVRAAAGQKVNLGEVEMFVVGWGWESPLPFRLLPGQETGNLAVRILTEDGIPVANADVNLCSKARCSRQKTSSDGEIHFREVEPGATILEVAAEAFYKETLNIRIVKGVEIEFRFLSLVRCRDTACQPPKFEGIWLE